MSGRSGLLWNVQILRFLAALMVLVEHLQLEIERARYSGFEPIQDPTHIPWRAGVDLFFVVSGFIMYYLTADAFGRKGYSREFLVRRWLRVVPLYWLFTGLMIFAIVATNEVHRNGLGFWHIVGSLAFIPVSDSAGMTLPVLAPGWTLNYEMLFYVAFATALLFPRRYGLLALLSLFASLITTGLIVGRSLGPLSMWTNPILLEFLYGIGIAHLFRLGVRFSIPTRLLIAVAAITLLIVGNVYGSTAFRDRWLFCGVPAAIMAAAMILAPEPSRGRLAGWLRFGGDTSYALYLSHMFSINALLLVWRNLGLVGSWWFIGAGCLFATLVGAATFVVVEKPLLVLASKRRSLRSAVSSPLRVHEADPRS